MAYGNSTFRTQTYIALGSLIALFWGAQAIAQSPAGSVPLGSIVANAYAQIPDKSAISIDLKEDTELSARLLPVFQEELLEQGYKSSSDAPLVLQISLEVESSAPPEGRVAVSGQGDSRRLSDAKVTVKVDRNSKNRAKKTWYRLEANLIDQNTKPVWKGAASLTDNSGRDRTEVAEMIVRSLMAEFGTTVRNKAIVE
jgi:hypothetical protein